MIKFFGAPRALRTAVVALSFLAAGCGSGSSSSQTAAKIVSINPTQLWASIADDTQEVARSLKGWEWGSFFSSFGNAIRVVGKLHNLFFDLFARTPDSNHRRCYRQSAVASEKV